MKTRFLTATIIALSILTSNTTAQNNYISSDVEGIGEFDKIISNSPCDIEFRIGKTPRVTIKGISRLVDKVNVTQIKNTITISAPDLKRVDDDDLQIFIEAPNLTCAISSGSGDIDIYNIDTNDFVVTLSGSGDIDLHNINVKSIDATSSGSGSIEISGSSDKAIMTVNGSGEIEAEDFRVETIDASVNGSGEIECRATHTLNASAMGSGEIKFHGRLEIINRFGTKKKIRHEDW